MKRFLRYLIAAPTFLWGVLYVYGAVLLRFAEGVKWEAPALVTARWRPCWARRWRWSSTVGRGIIYHPNLFTPVYADGKAAGYSEQPTERYTVLKGHEETHVRQHEDLCLHGLVGALVALLWLEPVLALLLWVLAPLTTVLNYAMAWLRGGDPYRDAEHERAAYAQHKH